jgi:hypothetical protein
MKTLFTLLLATAFTSAFAYDEGRLTITVASATRNLEVHVNGRIYSDNDNTIVIDDVQPGNHTVRIYRNTRGNGNGRNDRNSRRNELLYSSTIYVKPSYHVDVMINRFGKALVDERMLAGNGQWGDDDRRGNSGGYYGNDSYRQPMNSSEFDNLVKGIRGQWFASSKMNAAREAVNRNYFHTGQVRQLLQLFSLDSDKLELARLAYRNTTDRNNYYSLNDVFSFQSTRDDLEKYVREFRDR